MEERPSEPYAPDGDPDGDPEGDPEGDAPKPRISTPSRNQR